MRRSKGYNQGNAIQRLQQGSRQQHAADKFDYSYYDRMVMSATVTETRLFQSPVGQNSKTLADTNMKVGGSMPNGTNFKAHALKVIYTSSTEKATMENFYKMLANTTVEIILDGKADLGTYTLAEIFGAPINVATTIATTGIGSKDNIQMSVVKGIVPFNYPITLAGLQQFEVKVRHYVAPDATLNGDWLQFSFNGRNVRLS